MTFNLAKIEMILWQNGFDMNSLPVWNETTWGWLEILEEMQNI